MSEYKRLTLHNLTSAYDYAKSNLSQEGIAKIYDRLAELEDKIESGEWVELPCKRGDTVYFVYSPSQEEPLSFVVSYIARTDDGEWIVEDFWGMGGYLGELERGGVKQYLGTDKAYAEAFLKELKENNNGE